MKRTAFFALLLSLCLAASAALAAPMTDVYNEYGAHKGLDPATQNVDISETLTDDAIDAYVNAGRYIVSNKPTVEGAYEENGTYYETVNFEYGQGLYIHIQDEESTTKHYTMIKSAQDLNVGDPYCYVEGDIGGRLLDDKYTSTLMANNYLADDHLSYVSYDLCGGKFSAQEVAVDENGVPLSSQPEGFTYVYLVAESPADYFQRLANEEAGYEAPANSEDRLWMPVNNTNSNGNPINNWANITVESEDKSYNDKIARIGALEGNSNTRLYSYSGQNVIVAKVAIGLTPAVAKIACASDTAFNAEETYEATESSVTLKAGETLPLYFHTQFTSTWGRDGYAKSAMEYVVSDDSVISYVGTKAEDGQTANTLTALKAGTATLTVTVSDSEGKYEGGATYTVNVTVE